MDPIYRMLMIRRIASARQKSCYIDIFKLIVDHNIDYTINKNGVFFNLSPLPDEVVRQIDEILKRCEQRKAASSVELPPPPLFCRARSSHVVCLIARILEYIWRRLLFSYIISKIFGEFQRELFLLLRGGR